MVIRRLLLFTQGGMKLQKYGAGASLIHPKDLLFGQCYDKILPVRNNNNYGVYHGKCFNNKNVFKRASRYS